MNTQPPNNENTASFDLNKIKARYAQEITQHFDLQSESQSLLSQDHTPSQFLQILINNGCYHDAVAFLAHTIPVHKATWWACLCNQAHLADSDELYQQTYRAAQDWLHSPTEKNRRKAEAYAEKSQYNTAASWIAAAAFWSGGNISPEGKSIVEPPPYLYATAVASAILLASKLGNPTEQEVKNRYQRYLKQGVNIANGLNE